MRGWNGSPSACSCGSHEDGTNAGSKLVSRARLSLWAELAGREKECLVTHVNIPQRLCQGSGKATSELSCGVR